MRRNDGFASVFNFVNSFYSLYAVDTIADQHTQKLSVNSGQNLELVLLENGTLFQIDT